MAYFTYCNSSGACYDGFIGNRMRKEETTMMQTPYLTVPLTRARIPSIGLGTFGSDRVEPDAIARAVKIAVKAGYRHIDCASVYGNERQIGEALASLFADGADDFRQVGEKRVRKKITSGFQHLDPAVKRAPCFFVQGCDNFFAHLDALGNGVDDLVVEDVKLQCLREFLRQLVQGNSRLTGNRYNRWFNGGFLFSSVNPFLPLHYLIFENIFHSKDF